MKTDKYKWTIVETTKEVFNTYINELERDMRQFVDEEVIAENYYLAMILSEERVLGGFATSSNGNIQGLFSLEKGIGKKLLSKQLAICEYDVKYGVKLKLTCIGDFLKKFYQSFGFEVVNTFNWDERLAPKLWNGKRFGFPKIYYMTKEM